MRSSQIGVTALMHAAAKGHLGVVMKLAELGVDLGAADKVSPVVFIAIKEYRCYC